LTNPQETDITTIIQRRRQHPRHTGRYRSEQVVAIVGMRSEACAVVELALGPTLCSAEKLLTFSQVRGNL
jgi:hypothetical protein